MAAPALSLRLRNILFATDFSPCSEQALPFARSLAMQFGSTLHLVHVLHPEPHLQVPLDHTHELDTDLHDAEEHMQRLLQRQSLKSITHKELIQRGPIWDVLQQVIEDRHIDLIVIGTHGRRGLKRLVLGSVAEEIFRRASCPVLIVGPHIQPDGLEEGRLSTVLYATDFSEGSSLAIVYAVEWARGSHARLAMVHVLPELPEIPEAELHEITEGVRHQLCKILPRNVESACETDPLVLFGSASDGILRAAREQQASLIVMSARAAQDHPGASHLPWATAHQIVCEARCPVLIVRKPAKTGFDAISERIPEKLKVPA